VQYVGHNWGCRHDDITEGNGIPDCPSCIMTPAINGTNTDWSAASGAAINNTKNSNLSSCVSSDVDYVTIDFGGLPQDNSDRILICTGQSISYDGSNSTSTNGLTWSFTGGSISNSNNISETVSYNNIGLFTTTLTMPNPTAQCNTFSTRDIDVLVIGSVDLTTTTTATDITANAFPATYQWVDCSTGNIIPGETNRTFTPPGPGSYAVIVTQSSCNNPAQSECINFNLVTGLEELNANSLAIYPNPTANNLTIELGDAIVNEITITDIHGKIVRTVDITNPSLSVSLDGLSNGLYFLRAVGNESVQTYKIIKQ